MRLLSPIRSIRFPNLLTALTVLLLLVVLLLNLSWSVRASYGRDENMFVAGAQLVAQQGLLPFRDFHSLHQPYLILVYALLFKFTNYLLLAGRFYSAVCATGVAVLVCCLALDFLRQRPKAVRYGLAWSAVLLLAVNPLYAFASPLAWNHSQSMFLAMLAVTLYWFGARRSRPLIWMFAGGLALGLAIGTRLSYVTAIPAFLLAMLLLPAAQWLKSLAQRALAFGLGGVIALLPALYLFLQAPQKTWFGNVTFHSALNLAYQVQRNYEGPITFSERITYLWETVVAQPGSLLLLVALVFLAYSVCLADFRRRPQTRHAAGFWLTLVPLVGVGSLIIAPVWYQHFYLAVPAAICAVVYGLAQALADADRRARWLGLLFVQIVIVALLFQVNDFRRISFLRYPDTWRPLIFHDLGVKIHDLVQADGGGQGKVLTLTPLFVLEGGGEIYPELATGAYMWRISSLVPPEQRRALNVIAPEDLETFLADDPPAGILVGLESGQEAPLNDYAARHGYTQVEINADLRLWLPAR